MIENEIVIGRVYRNKESKKLYEVESIGKQEKEPIKHGTWIFYKALYKDSQPYRSKLYLQFKENFEELEFPKEIDFV